MKSLIAVSVFSLFFSCKQANSAPNQKESEFNLQSSWIVSPSQAKSLLTLSNSILLDSREKPRRLLLSIPQAKPVSWEDWSISDLPYKGNILSKEDLEAKWKTLNINKNSWIIVIGSGLNGWGEEGRLVWTLREMGYDRSYWVDGGDSGFIDAKPNTNFSPPNNIKSSKNGYAVSRETIQAGLYSRKMPVLIDTREEREYKGSTPYGESRGGHIPGAKWIHYKEFMNTDGKLKNKEEIQKILSDNKIYEDSIIIPYCTGGIRSAWVTGVLVSYGYQAKNYAGSMWEWTSGNEKDFPVHTDRP
jgi:thiosulfate/3-mercaptopyruvate sulfurtransferase